MNLSKNIEWDVKITYESTIITKNGKKFYWTYFQSIFSFHFMKNKNISDLITVLFWHSSLCLTGQWVYLSGSNLCLAGYWLLYLDIVTLLLPDKRGDCKGKNLYFLENINCTFITIYRGSNDHTISHKSP